MKLLFLDESGDHNLDTIDPQYPVFVLGGVITDRQYMRATMVPRVRRLKREFFGREDIILHTADIARARNEFVALKDPNVKDRFLKAITTMMEDLDYLVVACAIDKPKYLTRHGTDGRDIYRYSLGILIERFCLEIGDNPDGGMIFAETRRPDLDRDLNLAWEAIKRRGVTYTGGNTIDRRIVDLSLKDKRLNIEGLQLADLIVSPIGRAVIGKPTHDDWRVVQSKFRRHKGSYVGAGLKVLPS